MTPAKRILWLTIFFPILFFGCKVKAQGISNEQPKSNLDAVIKISGFSPSVGITYQIGNDSRLQALGFISINSFGSSDSYFLDLSYLKKTNWIASEDIDSYWGVNLHSQIDKRAFGPGLLVGTSYSLNGRFAVFGEAVFNVFISDNRDIAEFGLSNSGLGLRVDL